jgi:UDP-glucose 4-epimerase
MKSLVTGGAGFIGSHIVDKLIDLGHEVTIIDNQCANNEKFYLHPKAKNYQFDIRDYESTRKCYDGIDYVFHLAAESRLQPAIENPIDAVSRNCVGTCTVLQCAREAGVKRVVYSSTSSGYGNNPHPNIETQLDDCLNPYSASKVAAEKFCHMYSNLYGLETIVLRYFNVYGDRAPKIGQYAPVISIFNRQKDDNEPITIVGDGSQRRDFVHVSDVVNANILSATTEVDASYFGQVFNVGSGKNYSVQEIADKIDTNQTYLPPRLGEVQISLANIEKIKSVFGWNPKVDLMEWISN